MSAEASVLVFVVDGHRCAIPAAHVVEIVRAVAVSRLIGAPPGVDGLCDLRGELVPVISMRTRVGLTDRAVRSTDFFVITRLRDRRIALRVDDVVALDSVAPQDVALIDAATVRVVAGAQGVVKMHAADEALSADEQLELQMLMTEGLREPE